jgi:hypothetical protein
MICKKIVTVSTRYLTAILQLTVTVPVCRVFNFWKPYGVTEMTKEQTNDKGDGSILLSITNNIQHYTIFFIIVNAVHVSGGFSTHHQELKNCTHSIQYVPGLVAATASIEHWQ